MSWLWHANVMFQKGRTKKLNKRRIKGEERGDKITIIYFYLDVLIINNWCGG